MSENIVGPWARDKLDILQKYLGAYTTIMKNQSWLVGFVYIDAFAGPGDHALRNEEDPSESADQLLLEPTEFLSSDVGYEQYVLGSPKVALELSNPFTAYVFVEKDRERVEELVRLKRIYPDRNIRIRQEDCNQYLLNLLNQKPPIDWRKWRGLIFLDPFGMQVPWETIEAMGKTKAFEIILNFPVGMAIQRLLKKSGQFTAKERQKLDSYFGDPGWYDVIYKTMDGLLGDVTNKVSDSGRVLVNWYRTHRLQSCFKYVSSARLVRNSRNGHLYYIIHATHNANGNKIANNILEQGEIVD